MLTRILMSMVMMVVVLSFAVSAFAAGISGKITAVEGTKVTVKVEQGMGDWVKKGAAVTLVGGGMTKIQSVEGDTIVIKSSKAAKKGVGAEVSLEQRAAGKNEQMQGC